MAILRQTPLPLEMQEVAEMENAGCTITLSDLDEMPVETVEALKLYRQVASVAQNGGELKI